MNIQTGEAELTVEQTVPEEKPAAERRQRRVLLGVVLAALAGVGYGTQAPLIKLAYNNGANVSTMLSLRFFIAMITVWVLLITFRVPLRQPPRKVGLLLLLGLIFITNSLFFYLAVAEMAVGTATLVVYCFPALVVLWSILFFKERLGKWRMIALVLSLAGCLLTVDPVAAFGAAAGFSWLGALFAFGSAFSNSWYMMIAAHYGRGVPGMVAAGYGLPVTTAGFVGWSVLSGQLRFDMSPAAWACCLAIGLLTAFSIVVYLIGISLAGPSRSAMTSTTEPAVVVLLSFLILGEELSLIKLAGGALILSAVILLSRRNK